MLLVAAWNPVPAESVWARGGRVTMFPTPLCTTRRLSQDHTPAGLAEM